MRTECKGLECRSERVDTPWGAIRVKVGVYDGRVVQVAPEFADCEAAAKAFRVPLKELYAAARAGYDLKSGRRAGIICNDLS